MSANEVWFLLVVHVKQKFILLHEKETELEFHSYLSFREPALSLSKGR